MPEGSADAVPGWPECDGDVADGSDDGDYKVEAGDRVEWFYASSDEESDGGGDKP